MNILGVCVYVFLFICECVFPSLQENNGERDACHATKVHSWNQICTFVVIWFAP